MNRFIFIPVKEVVLFHVVQVETFGYMHGIRDINLLQSAINMPQASFGGEFLHKNIYEMAAAYIYHIIKNHPFFDGNKRTGVVTGITFLKTNDIPLQWSQKEVFEFGIQVAESKLSKEELTKLLRRKK